METAGFKVENVLKDPYHIWFYQAHEKGGHSRYSAIRHVAIYRSPEDAEYMEKHGEAAREFTKMLEEKGFFDELDRKLKEKGL